jgi:23S rRNA pseudouridine1911/1915/1917 synthase
MNRRFIRFRVVPTENGMTLRNLMIRRMAETDRHRASAILHAGGVYVNRLRVKLGTVRVVAGERITIYPDACEAEALDPNRLVIAYREAGFMIVDKPAGVPVDPTKESAVGTLSQVVGLFLKNEGTMRPYVGVVHRLDRRASGLVLLTTRSVANKNIHHLFVSHAIARVYRIRVHNSPPEQWTCETPLVHLANGGVRLAKPGETECSAARTRFRRLGEVPALDGSDRVETLVEVELETGKTHQIRAHAQACGYPLVGERRYTSEAVEVSDDAPLCLFAKSLRFDHPETGKSIHAQAVLPTWARLASELDLPRRWEEEETNTSEEPRPVDG